MKLQRNSEVPHIGDIYLVHFNGTGNEQRGYRPGVIFQNNLGNQNSPNVIILPLTSAIKKVSQPTHVFLPKEVGLARDSMVLCENPEIMSKEKLGKRVTTLPEEYISQIAVGNLLASSAISFVEPDKLLSVWQKALALNAVA